MKRYNLDFWKASVSSAEEKWSQMMILLISQHMKHFVCIPNLQMININVSLWRKYFYNKLKLGHY